MNTDAAIRSLGVKFGSTHILGQFLYLSLLLFPICKVQINHHQVDLRKQMK